MQQIYRYIIYFFISCILWVAPTGANEEFNIAYEKNIAINSSFTIDLTELEGQLEQQYQRDVFFEWDIRGASTQKGSLFQRVFESSGEKEINLTIYQNISGQKNLIYSENITTFVYKNAIAFLYDESIPSEQRENFIQTARSNGVYVFSLGTYEKNSISGEKILGQIGSYEKIAGELSDYIGIWGEKEFILNSVGKIHKQTEIKNYNTQLQLALFSSFNKDILESFMQNLISDTSAIKNIIISDTSTRFQAIEQTGGMSSLIEHLKTNDYNYANVISDDKKINIWFISNFVSTLSQSGFPVGSIYLIVLLPILLLMLSIMKHIVGFSPLGIMIPIGITLLMFQLGVAITTGLLITILLFNLALSKIMSRYNLLYTPKISLLLSINIVCMIPIITLLFQYSLIPLNVENIIFVILFILIAEKLIVVIIGKEFREYKNNFLYTIMFALISYALLQFEIIQIFLLAYPEIILALIPLNFWIGRFTGLRFTEYFRFRDVIHSVEEE